MSEAIEKEIPESEQLELEVNTDDNVEIEVVDDTPDQDRNRPKRSEGAEPNIPDDDEIKTHGESAQKRIKQLKYEYHEERRVKEDAERLRDEAVKYAQSINKENEKLRKTLKEGENVLFQQATGRADAELETAKNSYRDAYETGDPDKILEAQQKLNKAQIEQSKIQDYKPVQKTQQQKDNLNVRPASPQQAVPPIQPIPPEGKAWAKKNTWFQNDNEMTGYAFGVHQNLIMGGVNPNVEPEKYYRLLDESMRKTFPNKFEDENQGTTSQAGNVVAPANRSAKKSRKVQLTKTALSLSKRLGITPEQYAAQVLKEKEAING